MTWLLAAVTLIAPGLFLAATLGALRQVGQTSMLTAVTLGALWLLLLIVMMRNNPNWPPILAGLATVLVARPLGGWVAPQAGWPAPLGQVAVVLAVMAVMAALNVARLRREQERQNRSSGRRSQS